LPIPAQLAQNFKSTRRPSMTWTIVSAIVLFLAVYTLRASVCYRCKQVVKENGYTRPRTSSIVPESFLPPLFRVEILAEHGKDTFYVLLISGLFKNANIEETINCESGCL